MVRNRLKEVIYFKQRIKYLQKNLERTILGRCLNTFLVDCKLSHFFLYSLRHSNIDIQLTIGIPFVTVSARTGHITPSTTSDIYAYVLK